jgi:L-lactate utilization protein LutB
LAAGEIRGPSRSPPANGSARWLSQRTVGGEFGVVLEQIADGAEVNSSVGIKCVQVTACDMVSPLGPAASPC